MSFKVVVLGLLLAACSLAYDEDSHVLVLHDDDFPKVFEDFPEILIQFYAPWCGHCKQLQPIYKEVAGVLHQQGLDVRVAKVDSTVEKKIASKYGIRGYPTLIYFKNGEQMEYNGQRSTELMVSWLRKRVTDPITEITKDEFEKLQDDDNDKVCIVFQGDLNSVEGKQFSSLASTDDYNSYFNVKETDKPGSVVMLRPFADDLTLDTVDETFKNWVSTNDRPSVLPFDDRTISTVFHAGLNAVCLFNQNADKELSSMLLEVAVNQQKSGESKLKFTEIDVLLYLTKKSNENFGQLASYLKVTPSKHPVFILNAKTQEKFIMKIDNIEDLSVESITEFINAWTAGGIPKIGMTDQVPVEVEEVAETTDDGQAEEEVGEL